MSGMVHMAAPAEGQLGLLLPAETLALLGAGPEGALAIQEFGWPTSGFGDELKVLVERLKGSDDADAPAALAATEIIVALARDSHAWLSVTSSAATLAPTLILVADDSVLAVRLHGEAVEYMWGSHATIARILEEALAYAGEEILVSAFPEAQPDAVRAFVGKLWMSVPRKPSHSSH